jgi:hypothetical protein
MAISISGTTLTFNDSTTQTSAAVTAMFRYKFLFGGTTYVPTTGCLAFWVFVFGATGGRSGSVNRTPGGGGPGYSEKYYPSPAASYSYTIGAGGFGGVGAGAGGTTTFGGVITVTGSGASTVSLGAGIAGGVGSGGDFNATGGTGGTSLFNSGGGGGGSASRAGNGGNGANSTGNNLLGGGGGGTGGNNASGGTGGAAATAKAAGALVLPFGQTAEFFNTGANATPFDPCFGSYGGIGANGNDDFNVAYTQTFYFNSGYGFPIAPSQYMPTALAGYGSTSGTGGSNGLIVIVEKMKN